MARVTGPLMSMEASGTLAKTLVFSKWKGRAYTRSHVIPANPKSDAQVGIRAMMRFLAQYWAILDPIAQALWKAAGASSSISPFNAFVARNMNNWKEGLYPLTDPTGAGALDRPTLSSVTAVGNVGALAVTINKTGDPKPMGLAIYVDTAAITPTRSQAKLVIPGTADAAQVAEVSGLAPGAYNVKVYSFAGDGTSNTNHAVTGATTVT